MPAPGQTTYNWPTDTELLKQIEATSVGAFAKKMGCNHCAVLYRIRGIDSRKPKQPIHPIYTKAWV